MGPLPAQDVVEQASIPIRDANAGVSKFAGRELSDGKSQNTYTSSPAASVVMPASRKSLSFFLMEQE